MICNETKSGAGAGCPGAVGFASGPAAAADTMAGRWLDAAVTGLASRLERIRLAWRRSRSEQVTVDQLVALEDHILRDIGIERSQIRTVARLVAENPCIDPRKLLR